MSAKKRQNDRLFLEELILTEATSYLEGANFTTAGARVFVPDRCVADLAILPDREEDLVPSGGGVTPKYSIQHFSETYTGAARVVSRIPSHYLVEEREAPETWRVSGPGWFQITAHGSWSVGGNLMNLLAQARISIAVGGLCRTEIEDLLSQAKMEAI